VLAGAMIEVDAHRRWDGCSERPHKEVLMSTQDERRESAIRQLNEKRGLRGHVVVYLLVNTMLVAIWAVTGAGFFWPIWPIAGWGIGLALNAYSVYFGPKPLTESEVQAEMDRQDQRRSPQR
jgi:hypothetical protein